MAELIDVKEFVAYVFWYYVLARFRADKKVTAATVFREATTRFLLRLAQHHARIGKTVDGEKLGELFPEAQVLRIPRAAVPDLLELEEKEKREFGLAIFDPPYANNTFAKPFWLHTTPFTISPARERWRGEGALRLDDQGWLRDGFLEVTLPTGVSLERYFFDDRAPTLTYQGGVLNAKFDETIWIARIEDESELLALARASNEERGAALRARIKTHKPRRPAAQPTNDILTTPNTRPTRVHATVSWSSRLETLRTTHDPILGVVETIAILAMVGVRTTYAMLREHARMPVKTFDALIQRLEAEAWITVTAKEVASDLDERIISLPPGAEGALRATLNNPTERFEAQRLYEVLSWADELHSMPRDVRFGMLSHSLTTAVYEAVGQTARRLTLLLDVLLPHDAVRAECAVRLAPYDPQRALGAVGEYLVAHPDADHLLPECLKASAEANRWDAFVAIWPSVAAHACMHSAEIITHLTIKEPPPLSRFAQMFEQAVWQLNLVQHIADIPGLCRDAFEDDHQCWTFWLGLPFVFPEFLEAIDVSRLSSKLRACPWTPST